MPFKALEIIPPILRALSEEGYKKPTPIQEQAIPIVLSGKDLLATAQTGTGKTAAFSIPILQLLAEDRDFSRKRVIRALIVVPTRELAVQVNDSLRAYGKYTGLTSTVIYGGVKQGRQTSALARGVDILVATPGRLLDLKDQGFVKLEKVEILVLDEADRMLDMGFIHDIKKLLAVIPPQRQSLFFSATMPPEIVRLADTILQDPASVTIEPEQRSVEVIRQFVYYVDKPKKNVLLLHVIEDHDISTGLVFTRTKHGADSVVRMLQKHNISAEAIHSNKSQSFRQYALERFKEGKTQILVATDIAARGIDIDSLGFVINYEIPNEPETYVHRIGRTGRAGASGVAFSFCSPDEKGYLRSIQKLIGKKIEIIPDHPFPSEELPSKETPDTIPSTTDKQQPRKKQKSEPPSQAELSPQQADEESGGNRQHRTKRSKHNRKRFNRTSKRKASSQHKPETRRPVKKKRSGNRFAKKKRNRR